MNSDYKFVSTDASQITARLIASYESYTNHTMQPGDPERLVAAWLAYAIMLERIDQNYVGNQNIPSRAEGENLDALGKWIYSLERRQAQPAKCTMRFHISEAQQSAISIAQGTRVSDMSQTLVWETVEDTLIPAQSLYVDVDVRCQAPGTVGNGYAEGQINTLIDVDNVLYYTSCENITESDGGAEAEDDETYFDMMRRSLDSYSTAGAEASYIYWAKTVSEKIVDVKAIRPHQRAKTTIPVYTGSDGNKYAFVGGEYLYEDSLEVYAKGTESPAVRGTDYTVDYTGALLKIALTPNGSVATANEIDVDIEQELAGHVDIYALMEDGTSANETIKSEIAEVCSDDYVRPMTDYVTVKDLDVVTYDIDVTYYLSTDSGLSLTDIQTAVNDAVEEYKVWQRSRIGRDINPSRLESLLMAAGVKRVVIKSPAFAQLRSGSVGDVPQIASVRNVTVQNGGYEDE